VKQRRLLQYQDILFKDLLEAEDLSALDNLEQQAEVGEHRKQEKMAHQLGSLAMFEEVKVEMVLLLGLLVLI
jgi:hypothetical protein